MNRSPTSILHESSQKVFLHEESSFNLRISSISVQDNQESKGNQIVQDPKTPEEPKMKEQQVLPMNFDIESLEEVADEEAINAS